MISPSVAGNVLVTGGGGFLGKHLVQRLVRQGCDVVVASRNASELSSGISVDLTNAADVKRMLSGYEFNYVFHVAGVVDQGVRAGIYHEQFAAHLQATLNLVECLNLRSLKRFVCVGSNAEYGSSPCPQSSDGLARPNSAYGVSKLAATSLILAKAASEGLRACVVRPFLIYGMGQSERSFLAVAMDAARKGAEFPTTQGLQTRDFTPVDFVVDDLLRAAVDENYLGQVVNSCTGHPLPIREVLGMMSQIRPDFRPLLGSMPYRASELMESYGVPLTPVSAAQARTWLLDFLRHSLA